MRGHTALIGALAGIAATAAMTIAAGAMFRRLPRAERYPLPPREITAKVAERAGIDQHLSERQRVDAALGLHFSYGAAAGALYADLVQRRPALPPALAGTAYGLAIWLVSYLGWLPAAGILRPVPEHPARRNMLMILAHVVWGTTLGMVVDGLEKAGSTFLASGQLRDVSDR
jgi:uncharacterized membrane protein YagU involved in acid resistance